MCRAKLVDWTQDENKHLFLAGMSRSGAEIHMQANIITGHQTCDPRGMSSSQRENRGRLPAPAWGTQQSLGAAHLSASPWPPPPPGGR